MREAGGPTPTIGVWGTFDLENYGDLLFPLIARHELEARFGSVELHVASPVGINPVRFDGAEPSGALGKWRAHRLEELAAQLDAVLVGGGEIIHFRDGGRSPHYGVDPLMLESDDAASLFFVAGLGPTLEQDCSVVWNAVGVPFELDEQQAALTAGALNARTYIAVRDEESRRRLIGAGVIQPISVVPDTAVLVPRLLPLHEAAGRVEALRGKDLFPPGRVLVLQGNHRLVAHAEAMAEAVSQIVAAGEVDSVVAVEIGPCHGDGLFADAVCSRLSVEWRKLPPSVHLLDLAAVIACSHGYVGTSLHGAITALAFGRSTVVLDLFGDVKIGAVLAELGAGTQAVASPDEIMAVWGGTLTPVEWEALAARVDAHFDTFADLVSDRRPSVGVGSAFPSARVAQERTARAALSRRYLMERRAADDAIALLEVQLESERAEEARIAAELASTRDLFEQERNEVANLREFLAKQAEHVELLTNQIADLSAQVDRLDSELELALGDSVRLRASHSWRVTAPLRWVGRTLR